MYRISLQKVNIVLRQLSENSDRGVLLRVRTDYSLQSCTCHWCQMGYRDFHVCLMRSMLERLGAPPFHFSEGSLVRRLIGPTAHWSDGSLVRNLSLPLSYNPIPKPNHNHKKSIAPLNVHTFEKALAIWDVEAFDREFFFK